MGEGAMTSEEHIQIAKDMIAQEAAKKARRYLDAFVRLKCAPDLLALKWFPNAKEISESMAALDAVRKVFGAELFGDPDVTLIAPGDGVSPRTAGLFAFMTRWECISIDPLARYDGYAPGGVERLTVMPNRIEDVRWDFLGARRVVVAAVHSHAELPDVVKAVVNASRINIVAIPCCIDQVLNREPDLVWDDYGILSPERTVMVWKDYRP